jgi:serine/threonine-protein kinase
VFARRVHERRELIESAMRAELTPHSAKSFDQLARVVGKEPSGSSSAHTAPKLPGPSMGTRVARVAVVALVLAAAVGIGVALAPREKPQDKPPAVEPPPAAPPVLVVDTVPTGATLVVDGAPRGMTPLTMEDLALGAHRLDATLNGYQPAQRTVSLPRAGERVVVELALVPAQPAAEPDAGAKPKPRVTAPAEAPGRLTLKTDPWTTVYFGKKNLGDTPLINVALPAGRHTLRVVNTEKHIDSTIEVEIAPNETTVKKLSF